MTESESGDELIDRVVEMVMRGEDPRVEALIAETPHLPPATHDKLRKLARAFGDDAFGARVVSPRSSELPFTKLGPYKLLSRMGEGGMGMVYLAEHEFLGRRVALKLIRPELAVSQITRQRFHREALSIAKLRHDNIVRVYDAGEYDGVAFLAMELVEGRGLDELLSDARRTGERLSVIAAVRHARGIALALECAHAAGIIHRDVKPSNVRITPEGRELLLDFGLSLAAEMAAISSLGQFRGTPQYASPEQIETDSAEIDARTDVYSLGVTLYECLTGQVPFVGANMSQLFHQILVRTPVEPGELNEGVDEKLNGIVMRAMAKRRDDRFRSAGEMASALDEWLRNSDRVDPTPRHRRSMLAKSVAAAVVLVLCGVGWLLLHDKSGALASAQQPAQRLVRSMPRHTTALLGATGLAFDQRLAEWGPLLGNGTFGADEDGAGVIGVCLDGITAEPRTLPGGNGCITGRVEPLAPKPGERTSIAGVGVEFSSGRIVALLLVPVSDRYDVRLCELLRDGESRLTRGAEIESRKSAWADGRPWTFTLIWNDTDTQFDWSRDGSGKDSDSLRIPRGLRDTARPSRFMLMVEKGGARFEELALEES